MTAEPSVLRDAAFMNALLDLLIPPGDDGRMPGAGSLDLSGEVADAVEADPRLVPAVTSALEAVRDAARARDPGGLAALPAPARLDVLETTLARQSMLISIVAMSLYPVYYQHPAVLEALGEPARPPFPGGFDVEPTDPELLERLRARARTS